MSDSIQATGELLLEAVLRSDPDAVIDYLAEVVGSTPKSQQMDMGQLLAAALQYRRDSKPTTPPADSAALEAVRAELRRVKRQYRKMDRALRYAWEARGTKGTSKHGEPITHWYETDSGEHRYQVSEPGTGRRKKQAPQQGGQQQQPQQAPQGEQGQQAQQQPQQPQQGQEQPQKGMAWLTQERKEKHGGAVNTLKGLNREDITPEQVDQITQSLLGMSRVDLHQVRVQLGRDRKGLVAQSKNKLVDALLNHVRKGTTAKPEPVEEPVEESAAKPEQEAPKPGQIQGKEPWEMTKEEYLSGGVKGYKGIYKTNWRDNQPIIDIDATRLGRKLAGYFSDSPQVAERFASAMRSVNDADVVSASLAMDRPLVVDAKGAYAKDFMTDSQIDEHNNQDILSQLTSGKYDGLVIKNTADEGTIYAPLTGKQIKNDRQHRASVESALAAGKPVPPEVLKDYPDLAAQNPSTLKQSAAPEESKPNVIGRGSTGDVVRVGDEVHKPATKIEAEVYKVLRGVEGVAPGRLEGNKIVTPHYPHVVSVDTVPEKQRHLYAPAIKQNLSRLVNAVTALSEAGYDYNDPIQVGFDKGKVANLIDFSAARSHPAEGAVPANMAHLANYLQQFGLGRHGDAMSRIGGLWNYVNDEGVREFDNESAEGQESARVASQLDGKPAKYAYYSFNGRTIPDVAQTGHRDGVNVVFSDKPLSDEFMRQWELNPAIHTSQAKDGASAPEEPKPTKFAVKHTDDKFAHVGVPGTDSTFKIRKDQLPTFHEDMQAIASGEASEDVEGKYSPRVVALAKGEITPEQFVASQKKPAPAEAKPSEPAAEKPAEKPDVAPESADMPAGDIPIYDQLDALEDQYHAEKDPAKKAELRRQFNDLHATLSKKGHAGTDKLGAKAAGVMDKVKDRKAAKQAPTPVAETPATPPEPEKPEFRATRRNMTPLDKLGVRGAMQDMANQGKKLPTGKLGFKEDQGRQSKFEGKSEQEMRDSLQMYEDNAQMLRSQGKKVPDEWLQGMEELRARLSGDNPAESLHSEIGYGHPQHPGNRPGHESLVPIKVDANTDLSWRHREVQKQREDIQKRIGVAEWKAKAGTPQEKKKAKEYLSSQQHSEDKQTISDLDEAAASLSMLERRQKQRFGDRKASPEKPPQPLSAAAPVADKVSGETQAPEETQAPGEQAMAAKPQSPSPSPAGKPGGSSFANTFAERNKMIEDVYKDIERVGDNNLDGADQYEAIADKFQQLADDHAGKIGNRHHADISETRSSEFEREAQKYRQYAERAREIKQRKSEEASVPTLPSSSVSHSEAEVDKLKTNLRNEDRKKGTRAIFKGPATEEFVDSVAREQLKFTGKDPKGRQWVNGVRQSPSLSPAGKPGGAAGEAPSTGGEGTPAQTPVPATKPATVSVREAQEAAMKLGPAATESILGPGGLSGASQESLSRLVTEANQAPTVAPAPNTNWKPSSAAKKLLDAIPPKLADDQLIAKHKTLKHLMESDDPPVATSESDGYRLAIFPSPTGHKGVKVLINKNHPEFPVIPGYWMDFWEPDHQKYFGVTKKQYAAMPREQRAKLEADLQTKKYYHSGNKDTSFAEWFARTYHPEEWREWVDAPENRDAKGGKPFFSKKAAKHWAERFGIASHDAGKQKKPDATDKPPKPAPAKKPVPAPQSPPPSVPELVSAYQQAGTPQVTHEHIAELVKRLPQMSRSDLNAAATQMGIANPEKQGRAAVENYVATFLKSRKGSKTRAGLLDRPAPKEAAKPAQTPTPAPTSPAAEEAPQPATTAGKKEPWEMDFGEFKKSPEWKRVKEALERAKDLRGNQKFKTDKEMYVEYLRQAHGRGGKSVPLSLRQKYLPGSLSADDRASIHADKPVLSDLPNPARATIDEYMQHLPGPDYRSHYGSWKKIVSDPEIMKLATEYTRLLDEGVLSGGPVGSDKYNALDATISDARDRLASVLERKGLHGGSHWPVAEVAARQKMGHRSMVESKVNNGEQLPDRVLADYPELAEKQNWYLDNVNGRFWDHGARKRSVESALSSGKPVPAEVLEDYPDLAAKYGNKPAPAPATPDISTAPPDVQDAFYKAKRANRDATKVVQRQGENGPEFVVVRPGSGFLGSSTDRVLSNPHPSAEVAEKEREQMIEREAAKDPIYRGWMERRQGE